MSEYSVQQQKIINQYRQSNNLGFVISDDEVVSIMQKEMQKTGKVYPGFENLAVSKKNNNESKKADIPSPIAPNNNLFGAVGVKDLSIGVTLERSNHNYANITPTQSQTDAINFLKEITTEADTILKEQDKESGVISSVVNTWQELFNKEYAKSTVKKELSKTQQDLALLEKSSKGEPIAYDFLGNPKVSTFEETFRSTRGVEFNEKNIQDCQEKAQDYAQVKTAVEIINKTKSKLSFTTKGDVASQMNPESASRAIIDAFKLAGVNSKEEINKTLKDINEKYKDHPDVKKYGGDFRLSKNKQGKYVIYRTDKSGYPAEATNEELKLIAKELSTRLDKSLATALGVEYNENATSEELSALTQNTLEKYQKDYEESFKKAYGKKDLKELSEEYVQKQQQGVANIEMGLNIASMALMVVPGGAVATSGWALKSAVALKSTITGAKVVRGLKLVDKAKQGVKIAQDLQKIQKVASPVIMANMTLSPTELLEQLSSENGMSKEEWQAWGEGVLKNTVYMTAGIGVSKAAEQGSALYKTKALVNTLKKAGKTTDEIAAMVKSNPVKFPNEIVKSFKKIDTLAKTLQVSSEVALDISSTYLLNKVMGNGDVTKQDWINSVAFAISGGVLQKQFAHLNTESKVKYIHDAFKEYGVTKEEAQNILKTMDDISEGKIRVKKEKVSQNNGTPEVNSNIIVDHSNDIKTSEVDTPIVSGEKPLFEKSTSNLSENRIIQQDQISPENFELKKNEFIEILKKSPYYEKELKYYIDSFKDIADVKELQTKIDVYNFFSKNPKKLGGYGIGDVMTKIDSQNIDKMKDLLEFFSNEKDLNDEYIAKIIVNVADSDVDGIKTLYNALKHDKEVINGSEFNAFIFTNIKNTDVPAKIEMYNYLVKNSESKEDIVTLLDAVNKENLDIAYELKENNVPVSKMYSVLMKVNTNGNSQKVSKEFLQKNLSELINLDWNVLYQVNETNLEVAKAIQEDPYFPEKEISNVLKSVSNENKSEILQKVKSGEYFISDEEKYSMQAKKIQEIIISKIPEDELKEIKNLSDYEYEIFNLLRKGKDVTLTEQEKSELTSFIAKNEVVEYIKNKKYSDDVNLILQAKDVIAYKQEVKHRLIGDIRWVVSCAKDNNGFSDDVINVNTVMENFEKNIATKLTVDELSLVKDILIKNSSKEKARDVVNFDYSLLSKRNIQDLLGDNLKKRVDIISEFLYCSDEEFFKKKEVLKSRPYLKSYNCRSINFNSWKELLDMTDSEYSRLTTPIQERNSIPVDINAYREKIKAESLKPLQYSQSDVTAALQASQDRDMLKSFFRQSSYKPQKYLPFSKFPQKETVEIEKLPSAIDLMKQLKKENKVSLSIDNEGGLNPTRSENPIIHPEDFERLNVVENAHIKIKYGAKTNWSNVKIARDIMQNFYDGNGHTLEGVKIDVVKTDNGSYKVKISGEGHYDYSHLESLGDSTKDGDSNNAGAFGEGTRIVAVNLLAKNTPSVTYACGDWAMTFGKSSDDIKTADMTQTLSKNPQTIKGNYIEFETSNENLIKEILNSKDFFYQPKNEDFRNFDYENEFLGFKTLPNGEKGNLYIVQRYEVDGEIDNGLSGLSLVFKKMPNDPELVKINNGQEYNLNTGRDRVKLNKYQVKELLSRYLQTMSDRELTQTIASLEDLWSLKSDQKVDTQNTIILDAFLTECQNRKLGIDFTSQKYVWLDENASAADREMAYLMGYKIAHPCMQKVGMEAFNNFSEGAKKPIKLSPEEERKIYLLDEGIKLLQENTDLSSRDFITKSDAQKPTLVFDEGGSPNEAAEAILSDATGEYLGHWTKSSSLMFSNYVENLATWIHEISHKTGGDTSTAFSIRLADVQKYIMDLLAHSPETLQKMQVLADLYNNTQTDSKSNFVESKYRNDILQKMSSPFEYQEYVEKLQDLNSATNSLKESHSSKTFGKKTVTDFEINKSFSNHISRNNPRVILKGLIDKIKSLKKSDNKNIEQPQKRSTNYKYEKLPVINSPAKDLTLPSTEDYSRILFDDVKTVKFKIPNTGGLNPTRVESPIIHENDVSKLDKVENARIKVRYGAKTNWSNNKIARDIMQNFYDGNGHTMEGVGVEIIPDADGSYKVRITGDGHYDYSHLESLGDSTKDGQGKSAGAFGEGTRIVAVNLISRLDTPYVEYGCGDWKMTFGRSSEDIQTANMTQKLSKNSETIQGNYIEFKTKDKDLITSILDAKDYFWHPYNKDFQNPTFENKYFAFNVSENNDYKGNIYYVQRYENQDGKMSGGLNNLTVMFKTTVDDLELRKVTNSYPIFDSGRDRMAVDYNQMFNLSYHYAKSMSDEELIKAIASLEPVLSSTNLNNPKLINSNKDQSIAFARGLVSEAYSRNLKIDFSDSKIVWVPNYKLGDFSLVREEVAEYLKAQGYKFAYSDCQYLGMKSADEVYKLEHMPRSLKPTESEVQKLRLLREAIELFKQNDKYKTLPDIVGKSEYIFDAKHSNNDSFHALIDNKKYDGLFIDRTMLQNVPFMNLLSQSLCEMLKVSGDLNSAAYSYELTDFIRSELDMFLSNPETAQKLKVLNDMYNQIK